MIVAIVTIILLSVNPPSRSDMIVFNYLICSVVLAHPLISMFLWRGIPTEFLIELSDRALLHYVIIYCCFMLASIIVNCLLAVPSAKWLMVITAFNLLTLSHFVIMLRIVVRPALPAVNLPVPPPVIAMLPQRD
jgi:hypothetical protein